MCTGNTTSETVEPSRCRRHPHRTELGTLPKAIAKLPIPVRADCTKMATTKESISHDRDRRSTSARIAAQDLELALLHWWRGKPFLAAQLWPRCAVPRRRAGPMTLSTWTGTCRQWARPGDRRPGVARPSKRAQLMQIEYGIWAEPLNAGSVQPAQWPISGAIKTTAVLEYVAAG